MRQYRPSLRTLPYIVLTNHHLLPSDVPRTGRIDPGTLDIQDCCDTVGETFVALTALLCHRGIVTDRSPLALVEAESIAGIVCGYYGYFDLTRPISLTDAIRGLSDAIGMADNKPGADETEDTWLTAARGLGIGRRPETVMGRTVAQTHFTIKLTLSHQYPIAAGIAIGECWEDLQSVTSGIARIPSPDEIRPDGTVVILDGWDDSRNAYSFRFAEGPLWGRDGGGWIPYDYLSIPQLVSELVVLTRG